ncbi:MAG: hypothetical protein IT183_09305 [Acidobacteria bacterium]|nr:hypothetical protein [Acidobacteriota bacterium]
MADCLRVCAIRVAMVLVCSTVAAGASEAQTFGGGRPDRPNRALFGGGVGATDHQLIFNGSLGGGYDRLVFPDASADAASALPRGLFFGSGSASLGYSVSRTRFSLSAAGNTSARYAPSLPNRTASSYGLSVSSGLALTTRTNLNGTFAASYQPLSALSLFPEMFGSGPSPIPTDYGLVGVSARNYRSDSGSVGLSHDLTTRSSLSFGYDYRHWPRADFRPALVYQGASARYSHQIGRGLSMRLGYGRRIGTYGSATGAAQRNIANHTIDAGVDFSRALSFSRSTSLSFSTGSAIVSDSVTTRYDIVGNASLSHQMGRTWAAGLSYDRHVGFVDALVQPTFSDSISANLGGLLSRRVSVNAGTGASFGSIGLSANANRYRAVRASVGTQVALSRTLGLGLGYAYYRYRFDMGANLPSGIGTRHNRHSVQLTLGFWLPLYHRAGSANAAR